MNTENLKCVIVADGELPRGIISNAAAIIGISLGRLVPEAVGCDVRDKSGCVHSGIIKFPVPVLNGTAEQIKNIRKRLCESGFERYFGVGLCGDKKKITSLTGSLPLLR